MKMRFGALGHRSSLYVHSSHFLGWHVTLLVSPCLAIVECWNPRINDWVASSQLPGHKEQYNVLQSLGNSVYDMILGFLPFSCSWEVVWNFFESSW